MKQYKPVAFLYLTASLGVNERKLFNIILHHLCVNLAELQKNNFNKSVTIEIDIERYIIHKTLDRINGVVFRLPKVVKDLLSKELQLIVTKDNDTDYLEIIKSLTLNRKSLIFQLNPLCNVYTKRDTWFFIDHEIQRNINRKNSLVIYELCMYHIISSLKNKTIQDTIIFEISIDIMKTFLGYDNHQSMNNSEIYRTSLLPSVAELNKVLSDFKITIKTFSDNKKGYGFMFKIEVTKHDDLIRFLKSKMKY